VRAALSHTPRVLVAEDDEDTRALLTMLLRSSGYLVVEAADGAGALHEIAGGRIEVALVDIGLPGMDGETVARRVRDAPNGRAVHMVAVTGYGGEEDIRRLLGAGFDAHLVKPVDIAALKSLLRKQTSDAASDPA